MRQFCRLNYTLPVSLKSILIFLFYFLTFVDSRPVILSMGHNYALEQKTLSRNEWLRRLGCQVILTQHRV
jgi:hypothetical protein